MNLIIDIGNSSTKLALVEKGKIIVTAKYEVISDYKFSDFLSGEKMERTGISSVKDIPAELIRSVSNISDAVHILSHSSKLPFNIGYKTPETLGTDRIAAAAGACLLYAGKDILIIDAGTAITFDFMEGSLFKGGNISPGIDTRFRALNHFTDRLPLLKRSENYSFPGDSTSDAIIAGVLSGVIFEINEYIRTFEEGHRNSVAILTGGDSAFLKDKITGNCIFIPDIVILGLNNILEYNA